MSTFLPQGYQRLKYIESSGTQYITIPYHISSLTTVNIK